MDSMMLKRLHGILAFLCISALPFRLCGDVVADGVYEPTAVSVELFGCENYSGQHLLVAGTNATARIIVRDYYPDPAVYTGPVCGIAEGDPYRDVIRYQHRITGIWLYGYAASPLAETAISGKMRLAEDPSGARSYTSAAKVDIHVMPGNRVLETIGVDSRFGEYVKLSTPNPISYLGADNCYVVELDFKLPVGDGVHGQYYWTAAVSYERDFVRTRTYLSNGYTRVTESHGGTLSLPYQQELEDARELSEGMVMLLTNESGRVFFMKDEMDDGKVPNWFRYWRDDGAVPQLKGAEFEAVPTFDGLFTSGGGNDVVFGGDVNAWGQSEQDSHKIKLFPLAGDGHYYARNEYYKNNGMFKYGHYDYIIEDHIANGTMSPNLVKFYDPSVFGIYTVECVIAHESQHLKQHDEYKAEIGEDNYRAIFDGEKKLFVDTINRIKWNYDADLERSDIEGFDRYFYYSRVSVEKFLLPDGKTKSVEKCDSLTDTMETQTYAAYGLSPISLDTYNLGEYKAKEYECYGDDEYLAMEAGYRAVHENSQVFESKDWAFPGHQSFLPAPFKRMEKVCVAAQPKALANLKSAGSLPSSDTPSDGKMECSSLVPVLCPSTGDVKYDGIRYDFSFDVEGVNWIEIIGVLGDLNSNVVAHANVEQVFTRENNNCALYFDGKEIYESRRSGPYMLLGLVFLRHDDMDVHFNSAVQGFDLPNLDCDYTDFGEEKYKEESVGGYAWRYVVEDGNAVISYALEYEDFKFAYLAVDPKPEGDVTVPSKLGGHMVVGIGDSAFYGCESLLTVTIPSSVTSLCENAFYSCTAITNLIFEGNAPVATERSFHRLNQDCIVTVREGTAGWDENHDGLWNGMRIVYRTWSPVVPPVEPPGNPEQPEEPPVEPGPPEEPASPEEPVGPTTPTNAPPTVVDEAETHVDVEKGEVAPYEDAAAVYDGLLYDGETVVGSVQVKVAKGKKDKSGVFSAKVTATVQLADEAKKLSFKGGVADATGKVTHMSVAGHELDITVGVNGLGGTFRRAGDVAPYQVDGARNVFSGKSAADKTAASEAARLYQGVYNVAFDDGTLSVSVDKKGKAKIAGTVEGNKVSATSQLVVGKDAAVVPVVITKKVNVAFCLWVMADGTTVEARGIDGATADRPGTLKAGARFALADDGAAGVRALPGLYGEYLPNGIDVAVNGTKWIVAGGVKAGKVAFVKGGNTVDESKLGKNPSGLKLTYKQKDGTFKGSFKVYSLESNGKIKAYTVSVTGVMIGTKGYGTATIKKPACTFLITIE